MNSKRLFSAASVLILQIQGLHAILRTSPEEVGVDKQSKPRVATEKTFGDSVSRILGRGKGSRKMMGMETSGQKGKGKGSDDSHGYYPEDYYYDYYQEECASIIAGSWSYITDASYTEVDVDGDSMISPGDINTFDKAVVSVFNRQDGSVIASGTLDGTCTVVPTFAIERDFCQFSFDFGAAGSVSIQGPFEKMTITGVTGCFFDYFGLVYGSFVGTEFTYQFATDVYAR